MLGFGIGLGLGLFGFLLYHLRKVKYYKEAINELLWYIDEEEI